MFENCSAGNKERKKERTLLQFNSLDISKQQNQGIVKANCTQQRQTKGYKG